MKYIAWILFLSVVCFCISARAATWFVEQDGSGDWVTIQAAVEASADGDTIQIGSGRYSNFFQVDTHNEAVVYWDSPKSLFLIGSGVDSTFVGPEEYVPGSLDSFGILYTGLSGQHIEGICFMGSDTGVWLQSSSATLLDCRTEGCQSGLVVQYATSGRIANCAVTYAPLVAVADGISIRNTQNILIESCMFVNMDFYSHASISSIVRNCVLTSLGNNVGAFYGISGGGVFNDNEVYDGRIYAHSSGNIVVQNSDFFTSGIVEACVNIGGPSASVELYRNVFHGGTYSTIYLSGCASIVGSENHIFSETGPYAVRLDGYDEYCPASSVDLRNNYWGTSDPDSVAAMIWDGNDDPAIQQTVQFEPFSTVPLPTEDHSLDSFKSMFR